MTSRAIATRCWTDIPEVGLTVWHDAGVSVIVRIEPDGLHLDGHPAGWVVRPITTQEVCVVLERHTDTETR